MDDPADSISAAKFSESDKDYILGHMIMDIEGDGIYGCVAPYLCMDCANHVDEARNGAHHSLLCGTSRHRSPGNFQYVCIALSTWNAAGLFCADLDKYSRKLKVLEDLLTRVDICGIQETHDNYENPAAYVQQRFKAHMLFRSFIDQSKGGILTLIQHDYIQLFNTYKEHHLVMGRIHVVELVSAMVLVLVVNVHLETDGSTSSKIEMLKQLHDFIATRSGAHVFMLGDRNFVLANEDRVQLRTGEFVGQKCRIGELWQEQFGNFDELYQPDPTRFPGGMKGTAARLDRIYQTASLENYAILDVKVATQGIFKDTYLSDHLPVVAKVSLKEVSQRKVHPQMTKHPDYAEIVQNMFRTTVFSK